MVPRPNFFPTVKTRPEFLIIKKLGLSWASKSFIIQGLITPPLIMPSPILTIMDDRQSGLIDKPVCQSSQQCDGLKDSNHSVKTNIHIIASPTNLLPNPGHKADHNQHQYLKLTDGDYSHQDNSSLQSIQSSIDRSTLNIDHRQINGDGWRNVQQNQQVGTDNLVFMDMAKSLATQDIEIGYVVTKKIGNAVKRNRAKRRLRELCKAGSHLFQKGTAQYVIIARHSILTQSFDILLSELAWTLKHLYRLHDQQNKTL